MLRRDFLKNTIITSTGLLILPAALRASGIEQTLSQIERCFMAPPPGAKPQCFWMWMNGNITKQGITLDLEAMHRMGIGGVINFNAAAGIPGGPVDYASEQWMDMLEHAVSEAARLGIEYSMHNSPGYSGCGGPWVTPEMSMQQLVWTEIFAESENGIGIQLPKPYAKCGYYRDAYVIAYPSPPSEKRLMKDALAAIYANGKEIDKAVLTDGNPEHKIRLETAAGKAVLLFVFNEPFEAASISILRKPETPKDLFDGPRDYPPAFKLQYSNDGNDFLNLGTVRCPELRAMDTPAALSFSPVKAKYYRLIAATASWVSNVELHGGARLGGWPGKTNYTHGDSGGLTPALRSEDIIQSHSVVDITDKMDANGYLRWKAPSGRWTILRIGHTTTGEENAAHPDAGKGLEIDKFNTAAVDFHFEHFLDKVIGRCKKYKSLTGFTVDSWEAGKQNWTTAFPALFRQENKYDIVQWMAAFTGRIIDSMDATERFLWDIRRTQANLLSENFYEHFAAKCHSDGLTLYAEPYGDGNLDSLQIGEHLDVTMSEYWTRYIYGSDVTSKQASSVAHVNNRKIVAAESFTAMPATSKWTEYPYALKAEGDYFFSLGVNRLVLHVFVHQPYTTGLPGMTMGPFGTHFDRNNTWTEQAYGWTAYLQRTQYLLQQGISVVDVCYYRGDDAVSGVPDIYSWLPSGYKGDVVNADALQRFTISNHKIVLPGGMQYKVCVMAPVSALRLSSLKRVEQLVAAGMVLIVNSKPLTTLGHSDDEQEFKKIVDNLYGNCDGKTVLVNHYGKGKIYWGKELTEVFEQHNILPDFTYGAANNDAAIHYYHKIADDTHFYFVSNHKRKEEAILASFNVQNYQPEIWDAETGERQDVLLYDEVNGITTIPLKLAPASSLFVVFRKNRKISFQNLLLNGKAIESTNLKHLQRATQSLVQNNFTVMIWVKPDTYAHSGKSMLFHAPDAAREFGEGQAAVAMNAGQNGVRIYERSEGIPKEVLYAGQKIEGYTHLALVYRNAKPFLYINGELIAEGKTSAYTVNLVVDTPASNDQFDSYFEGNSTEPLVISRALTQQDIYNELKKGIPAPALPNGSMLKLYNNKLHALFFQNGIYTLSGKEREKQIGKISGCDAIALRNEWQLSLDEKMFRLPKLMSLHLHQQTEIKYFSGTAIYSTVFQLHAGQLSSSAKVLIHLGRVEVIAEISVNGKKIANLWKEPFMADITNAVVAGTNHLEIAVTTLWPNRLIGDEQLPGENNYTKDNNITVLPEWYVGNKPKSGLRKTFSVWKTHDKDSPLLASGLLGPVCVIFAQEKIISLN